MAPVLGPHPAVMVALALGTRDFQLSILQAPTNRCIRTMAVS